MHTRVTRKTRADLEAHPDSVTRHQVLDAVADCLHDSDDLRARRTPGAR